MTFNIMRISKEKLEKNKRKHQEMLKGLVGRTVIGHNIIIEEVASVDVENDTVTGINTVTGEEITVAWKEITFTER